MSSFIERFSIAGGAGVLGLAVVLGVYGFASHLTVEPDESQTRMPGADKVLVLEGVGIPLRNQAPPQGAPPAEPGEPAPEEPTPLEELGPADEGVLELEPAILAEPRSGGSLAAPAPPAPATPAPAPAPAPAAVPTPEPVPTAPPPTPEPPRPTPTAIPTPEPTPEPTPPLPSPDPTLPAP